jgi:hypothetical protein
MKLLYKAAGTELRRTYDKVLDIVTLQQKSDWGTLVPRINVENGIKLGFLLE